MLTCVKSLWRRGTIGSLWPPALLCLVFVLNNLAYVSQHAPHYMGDEERQFRATSSWAHLYEDRFVPVAEDKKTRLALYPEYPPLLQFTTAPFLTVFGHDIQVCRAAISLYTVILVLAVYWLGFFLGGRFCGVLATLITCSSPHIVGHAVTFFCDVPLTAAACVLALATLKWMEARTMRLALVTGALFGLGLLLKPTALLFTAGLFLVVLWRLVIQHLGSWYTKAAAVLCLCLMGAPFVMPLSPWLFLVTAAVVVGLFIGVLVLDTRVLNRDNPSASNAMSGFWQTLAALGCAVALASPWYLQALERTWHKVAEKSIHEGERLAYPIFGPISHAVDYAAVLYNVAMGPPFFVLFGLGLVAILWRWRRQRAALLSTLAILLLWYAGLSAFPMKTTHWILPVIPLVAVIGAYWVSRLGRLRVALGVVIMVLSAAQLFSWLVPRDGEIEDRWYTAPLYRYYDLLYDNMYGMVLLHPYTRMGDTGVKLLRKVSRSADGRRVQLTVSNLFHVPSLARDARRLGLPVDVLELYSEDVFSHPEGTDYVLVFAKIGEDWTDTALQRLGATGIHFMEKVSVGSAHGYLYRVQY